MNNIICPKCNLSKSKFQCTHDFKIKENEKNE